MRPTNRLRRSGANVKQKLKTTATVWAPEDR